MNLFSRLLRSLGFGNKAASPPIVIINKDSESTEFNNIEDAVAELERDFNISKDKIEVIKASIRKLKAKNIIKIKNGEILD